jgi:predicted transcriptional regulator
MDIILPIQQSPFARIFSYKKHYEFRKKVPKETTGIYLYLSKTGIIAYLQISKVLYLDVNELVNLAELSELNSGDGVKSYFGQYQKGYALEISNRKKIDKINIDVVPQGFIYANRLLTK